MRAQSLAIGATAGAGAELATAPARAFAEFEIFDDPRAARAAWAEIYPSGLATPYQSADFVEAWLRTIGRSQSIRPTIVVVHDDLGKISAILPLGVRRRMGIAVAEFAGGKHANFHMGVYRRGLAVDADAVTGLLRRVAAAVRFDAVTFVNQPRIWQGMVNPLATLKGQDSPSLGHAADLSGGFTRWLETHYSKAAQKKLRKKTRRLEERAPVSFIVARDKATAAAVLAAFFAHKKARSEATRLANDFDDSEAARFLEIAATEGLARGEAIIELHALRCGERIIAVFGGVAHAGRFCGMIISYDHDPEIARSSPGELLIHAMIRDLIARGFSTFDLGVGEARYKDACCERTEALFDTAIGFTLPGRVASVCFLLVRRAKRWVKQTPWAWSLIAALFRRAH